MILSLLNSSTDKGFMKVFFIFVSFITISFANDACFRLGDVGKIIDGLCNVEFKNERGFSYLLYSDPQTCATENQNMQQCNPFLFGPSLCIDKKVTKNTSMACLNEFKKQWNESKKIRDKRSKYKARSLLVDNIGKMPDEVLRYLERLQSTNICKKNLELCRKLYSHMAFIQQVDSDLMLPYGMEIEYPEFHQLDSRRPLMTIKDHDYGTYAKDKFKEHIKYFGNTRKVDNVFLPEIVKPEDVSKIKETPPTAEEQTQFCLEEIESYFKNSHELSKDKMQEYLKVQTALTLHRLAWANLKSFRYISDVEEKDKKKYTLEQNIKRMLLTKITMGEYATYFDEITEDDLKNRSFLFDIVSNFHERINDETSKDKDKESSLFELNLSDVKMLSILKEYEEKDPKNTQLMSLSNIINSSYLNNNSTRLQNETERYRNQKLVERHIKNLKTKYEDELLNLVIEKCLSDKTCSHKAKEKLAKSMFPNLLDVFYGITKGLQLRTDTDFANDLNYGSVWLKVTK